VNEAISYQLSAIGNRTANDTNRTSGGESKRAPIPVSLMSDFVVADS
jgi:hypothetical protein